MKTNNKKEFFFTFWMYPLEFPMHISRNLYLTIDNPRTSEEISWVALLIKVRFSEGYVRDLKEFVKKFFETHRTDNSYIDSIYKSMTEEIDIDEAFLLLAKSWIILRYNSTLYLSKNSVRIDESLTDGNISSFEAYIESVLNFCSLLSAVIKDNYIFLNLIVFEDATPNSIPNSVLATYAFQYIYLNYPEERDWMYFPKIINMLLETANNFDQKLETTDCNMLLYTGNLNMLAWESQDNKVRLLMLVSIMELFLTHNPDYNRFNIEDSISKQFKLKISLILYMHDQTINLDQVKKKIGAIYTARSNIAHGNFVSLNKIRKENNTNSYELYDMVVDMHGYVKIVLMKYLEDNNFIKFLKNN